jgi:hypothetical protein
VSQSTRRTVQCLGLRGVAAIDRLYCIASADIENETSCEISFRIDGL